MICIRRDHYAIVRPITLSISHLKVTFDVVYEISQMTTATGCNIQYYCESDQNHRKKRYLAHLGSDYNDIRAPAENSELQMLYFEIKFVAPHLQELLLSVPRNSSIR